MKNSKNISPSDAAFINKYAFDLLASKVEKYSNDKGRPTKLRSVLNRIDVSDINFLIQKIEDLL